jgi:hypothetical protein
MLGGERRNRTSPSALPQAGRQHFMVTLHSMTVEMRSENDRPRPKRVSHALARDDRTQAVG